MAHHCTSRDTKKDSKDHRQERRDNYDIQCQEFTRGTILDDYNVEPSGEGTSNAEDNDDEKEALDVKSNIEVKLDIDYNQMKITTVYNEAAGDNSDVQYKMWCIEKSHTSHCQMTQFSECNASYIVHDLKPNKVYDIYILEIKNGLEKGVTRISAQTLLTLRHRILDMCLCTEEDDRKVIGLLNMKESDVQGSTLHVKEYGIPKSGEDNKSILLVGETGSGKTAWINAFINFLFCVRWDDPFRFKIAEDEEESDQTKSKTRNITVYKLHHQEGMAVNFTVTIIDTPGFCDTKGIGRDREIEEEIHSLFRNKNGYLEHINVVAFVLPVSVSRVTATQKYIFDSIMSLFGKNIDGSLIHLATFSQRKNNNNTLRALQKHDINITESFHFSTQEIMDTTSSHDDSDLSIILWDKTIRTFKEFSHLLEDLPSKSISQSQDVLDEREKVRLHMASIRDANIDLLILLNQFVIEKELLQSNGADCIRDERKQVIVHTVAHQLVTDGESRSHIICTKCQHTCHKNCPAKHENEMKLSIVMDQTKEPAKCKLCPNRCPWDKHELSKKRFKRELKHESTTIQDVKNRYKIAYKNVPTFDELNKDCEAVSARIKANLSEISNALKNLQDIALLYWPKSQNDYIVQLIQTEYQEQREGYKGRIFLLRQFQDEAKSLEDIEHGGHDSLDPFRIYRESFDKEIAAGKDVTKLDLWREIYMKILQYFEKIGLRVPLLKWRNDAVSPIISININWSFWPPNLI